MHGCSFGDVRTNRHRRGMAKQLPGLCNMFFECSHYAKPQCLPETPTAFGAQDSPVLLCFIICELVSRYRLDQGDLRQVHCVLLVLWRQSWTWRPALVVIPMSDSVAFFAAFQPPCDCSSFDRQFEPNEPVTWKAVMGPRICIEICLLSFLHVPAGAGGSVLVPFVDGRWHGDIASGADDHETPKKKGRMIAPLGVLFFSAYRIRHFHE